MENESTKPQIATPYPIFLSFVTLALLVATGFLYYQNQQLSQQIAILKAAPTPILTISPTPTYLVSPKPTPQADDPTANWKTYTDPLGFSIKYPSELVASESGNRLFLYIHGVTPTEVDTFVPVVTIGNSYNIPSDFKDLSSWAKTNNQIYKNKTNDKFITLGTNNFLTFESDSGQTAYAIHYLIADKKYIYDFVARISGSNEDAGKKLVDYLPQILATIYLRRMY